MPVRLRITLLFSLIAFVILSIVCGGIYYFSHQSRLNIIKTRLTNRAITTARLLSQREIFDQQLVRRIDSLTTVALKNKTVQAYDYQNSKLYSYSDIAGDTLTINKETLDNARISGTYYFTLGDKEAVAYHFVGDDARMVVVAAAEDEEGFQNLRSLLKILLASFLMGFLAVLLSGYLFSRSLLKPIKKISDDAAEISAQNLSRRIKTGGAKDEWRQLTETLNSLLNRLQEGFELQRRFISNASHELSTPLTSISSQLEVSLQRERKADDYKAVMHSIYQDVQQMSKLTKTLLEFAKASGNKGGLEIVLLRMDEIIMRLPAELVKLAPHYHVALRFENLPDEEGPLLVYGNEPLLLTALKNIAVNACKYSDDHKATVQLSVKESSLQIRIKDNGMGIAPDKLATIFQPFYRVEENSNQEGFGLGLSLAERIIKLHKGSIQVNSAANKGTEFIISLPGASATHGH